MKIDLAQIYNTPGLGYEAKQELARQATLSNLQQKQDFLKKKNVLIEELEYEKKLVQDDIISYIQTDINSYFGMFSGLSDQMYSKFFYIFHQPKEERTKEEQGLYKMIINDIITKFFHSNKDFKIDDVYDYNFSEKYEFLFKYKKYRVYITIPQFSHANEKNYLDLLTGYNFGIEKNEHCWEVLYSSLRYEEVADFIKNWVENQSKDLTNDT